VAHEDNKQDKAAHVKDSARSNKAIVLGDAAALTQGGSHKSVEGKQRPYN